MIQPGRRPAGQTPIFEKIGIVGLGLIGGSIALAARELWPSSLVIAVDNKDVLETAMRLHAIDVAADDLIVLAEVDVVILAAPVRQNIGELRSTIDSLIADGGTAFYDASIRGFDDVRGLNDRSRINAVVLLTDGEDTDSSASVDQAAARMAAQGDSDNAVRVFTIAYSASAEGAEAGLKRIAAASGGQEYTGDTEDIELVYRSISSFF